MKPIPRTLKLARGRTLPALFAFACLIAAFATKGALAQQPSNQNTQAQAPHAKRLTPLRTSEGPQGSRVTITSDGELNDYSAYRSGDRFIVIIPQAQGGDSSGARGRGFEGAQVSRRGNDLVYTFKLAPGASARVNQRFNRLDVQFTASPQSTATATPAPTPRTPTEVSGIKSTPTPAVQPTPAASARTTPTPAQMQVVAPTATNATNANPNEVSPSLSFTPAPSVSPSVEPSQTPQTAPTTPEQIAQAQPAQTAPVDIVSHAPAASTSRLGTVIARNYPWIIVAMIGIGIVFLLVSRYGERSPAEPLPVPLEGPAASKPGLRDEEIAGSSSAMHDDEATLISAATPAIVAASTPLAVAAAAETARVKTKKGKRRKEDRRNAKRAAKAEAAAQVLKVDAKSPETTAETASDEITQATTPATLSSQSTTPATETSASESHADAASETTDATKPTTGATKLVAEAALIAAPLVAAGVVAYEKSDEKSVESVSKPADTERVGEEMRKLLAGDAYDESVVGASDSATRDLVASELTAALSSRQPARNARAREAFLRHGYFDDATRNLQSAEAPGQRASAAHALSLLRDRAATPHLVAALEDPSAEVRRTSVEALAELRDPAALEPLEALRWRETSRQVPRALIMRAIEASTPAAEEIDPTREREKVDADDVTAAAQVAEPTAAIAAAEPEAQPLIEAEPALDESVGEAVIEQAAPVAEAATLEAVAPTVEEEVGEETVESPTVEAAPQVAEEVKASESAGPVYTFDETEAAAWTASHADRDSEDMALHGTGGLDGSTPVKAEGPVAAATSEEASEAHVYSAPEFAIAEEARTAEQIKTDDDWLDLTVEEQHVSQVDDDQTLEVERGTHASESAHAFESVLDVDAHAAPIASAETLTSAGPSMASESVIGAEPVEHVAWQDLRSEAHETASAKERVAQDSHETARVPVEKGMEIVSQTNAPIEKGLEIAGASGSYSEKGIEAASESDAEISIIPKSIQLRLDSEDVGERAASVRALARLSTGEAFHQICAAFDDPSPDVRNAAARALHDVSEDRADTFTRALRESPPERRRQIGASLSSSGLADEAVSQLTGESRERTYDAFSLLFLMAKAGETAPLIRAIESHPDTEVRLAVVKLLALSGQHEVLTSFKRLAVRGSLPNEVRSAVMEAIYQISSAGTQPTKPTGA
jgi:HEAT repeat protein